MTHLDYLVLVGYMVGLLVMGGIFSTRIRNSADMFAAGGQSPWWVSGLSGFMTIFSAATFVVWGGIAFRLGIVAVSILMTFGFGAVLTGYLLAGRWRTLGVTSAAEYLDLRFGPAVVQFYTWLSLAFKMICLGVALYGLAKVLCALIPLQEGNVFCDPRTGTLSINWAIILCGIIVVAYTVAGGLWAVLMTDVLQFIVLSLSVLFVIPLCLWRVGGVQGFLNRAPDGFMAPAIGEFTWLFLISWVILNAFRIGGEWAYVQRFLCVPTAKDAKKAAYLFGVLYLVSPLLWMLPPMLYRVINPQADPEQAYILACKEVLPAGMVGMMVAAMFSATASMASSELNVYAGVLTHDFYRKLLGLQVSEGHLVWVGRGFTLVLGVVFIGVALAIPYLGGAERTVLVISALFAAPMAAPTVWGLFSKRVTHRAVWSAMLSGFAAGFVLKCGFVEDTGWFVHVHLLEDFVRTVQSNMRLAEAVVGLGVPLLVLLVAELYARRTSPGWQRLARQVQTYQETAKVVRSSTLPARMVGWSVGILGLAMAGIALHDTQQWHILGMFSAVLLGLSGTVLWYCRRERRIDQ